MSNLIRNLSLATFGATALALGNIAPAQANSNTTTLRFSGTTGTLMQDTLNLFPEYQNAHFTGYLKFASDAEDLNPSPKKGKFALSDFRIFITNELYPHFSATIKPNADFTKAFIKLGSFSTPIDDADIFNDSTHNPTVADFSLFFTDVVGDPNDAPTRGPKANTFKASQSFLNLAVGSDGPSARVRVTSASFQAVPEPSTMAGLGIVGLGMWLKKRSQKQA